MQSNCGKCQKKQPELPGRVLEEGNIYMKMSEELGQIYNDSDFQSLYPVRCGQSALSPSRLALITIMQLAKTNLQHIGTAGAINLSRLFAWWQDIPIARSRFSHQGPYKNA